MNGHPGGNVVGNHYDKYGTSNPIARAFMRGFLGAVTDLYRSCAPASVLEVGCGEGRLARHLRGCTRAPERFVITDLDIGHVDPDLPRGIEVQAASIYDLPFDDGAFDLVVCCEVLEHLDDPATGLAEVARVAGRKVLLSTPWEPVWRAMNLARGKYVTALGNTPGHVQHFSRRGLRELAETRLSVNAVRRPLPWTVILGEPRR